MQEYNQILMDRIKRLHKDLLFFIVMFVLLTVANVANGFQAIDRLEEIRDVRQTNVELLLIQSQTLRELQQAREHEKQLMDQHSKDAAKIRSLQAKTPAPKQQGIAQKPINGGGGVVKASYYDYNRIAGYPGFTGHTHLTAASRDYPKGTKLRVCRADDQNRCVDVLVNDYGPQAYTGKSIDLSKLAFMQIESIRAGVVKVTITKI